MTISSSSDRSISLPAVRWRTVDIVVVAVLAAVFGVVYWAWGLIQFGRLLGSAAPLAAFVYTVFVMAGPLAALIVRRPGAAIAAELLAALFEALVSVTWAGTTIVVYGLVEGAAAELAFLLVRYRNWSLPVALLSGGLAGLSMAVLDIWVYDYYPTFSGIQSGVYYVAAVAGGLVLAGGLSWLIVRSLAATGVLAPFASGRQQKLV